MATQKLVITVTPSMLKSIRKSASNAHLILMQKALEALGYSNVEINAFSWKADKLRNSYSGLIPQSTRFALKNLIVTPQATPYSMEVYLTNITRTE